MATKANYKLEEIGAGKVGFQKHVLSLRVLFMGTM